MQHNAKQRAKATSVQLNHLIEFMKLNPECASGRSDSLQGRVALEQQWQELGAALNALGGSVKSVAKWKQTWRDLRSAIKKKALKNKKEQIGDGPGGTGSGPCQLHYLNAQDEAVLSVIGPVAIYGMEDVPCTMPVKVELGDSPRRPTLAAVPEAVLPPSPLLPQAKVRAVRRRRRRIIPRSDTLDSQILKFEKERLDLQKKHLVIEEKKVKALERIAAVLESFTE